MSRSCPRAAEQDCRQEHALDTGDVILGRHQPCQKKKNLSLLSQKEIRAWLLGSSYFNVGAGICQGWGGRSLFKNSNIPPEKCPHPNHTPRISTKQTRPYIHAEMKKEYVPRPSADPSPDPCTLPDCSAPQVTALLTQFACL